MKRKSEIMLIYIIFLMLTLNISVFLYQNWESCTNVVNSIAEQINWAGCNNRPNSLADQMSFGC